MEALTKQNGVRLFIYLFIQLRHLIILHNDMNTIQYNTIQYNAMQCNAMQCNAMQCNAMQCNAMQWGQGGQRCPFNLKDYLGEIANCQKCSAILLRICFRKRKKCSHRASRLTIARRRTKIENMIRRSLTPDVLQTFLSIYQFKSALSRKSAPLAFTSFRRPCKLRQELQFKYTDFHVFGSSAS